MISLPLNRPDTLRRLVAGLLVVAPLGFATASAGENTIGVDRLLPRDTLFVISSDDAAAYAKASETLPLAKIMAEQEVQTFLAKPKAALKEAIGKLAEQIQQQEGFENFELDSDKLMAGTYGRVFVALTHIRLPNPQAGINAPDIGLVLGIEGRDGAPDWGALIKDVVQRVAAAQGIAELGFETVTTDGGATYEKLGNMPGMMTGGPTLAMGRVGDMQVFSTSADALAALLERARGGGDAENVLAASASYAEARKAVALEGADTMRLFVNLQNLLSVATEGVKLGLEMDGEAEMIPVIDKVVDKLGLNGLKVLAWADRPESGVSHSRGFVGYGKDPKGLLDLCEDSKVNLDLLKLAPSNAAGVSVGPVPNLAKLYDLIFDVAETINPEVRAEMDAGVQQFSSMLGADAEHPVSIRDELFANLGPQFALIQPQSNSPMTPSFVAAVEMRNGPQVLGMLEKLLQMGANMSGGAFSVKTTDYKGTPITQVDVEGSSMMPINPCYAEIDGRLVLALSTGDLKRQLKRGDPTAPTIVDNEDFQRFWDKVPQDDSLRSLAYADTRYTVESVYGQIAMMLPMFSMATGGEELPFDPALMPSQETITKHLFGSLTFATRQENGATMEGYGPIGGDVVAKIGLGAVAAGVLFLPARMTVTPSRPSIEAHVTEEGTEPAPAGPEEAVDADLRNLRRAITFYKLDIGELPATLEQLLEPTAHYPDGCFGEPALPMDPWGNAYHYRVEGRGCLIWSSGPDGMDNSGDGDDIAVRKD